ncbi:MAG: SapC family protein [Gammaproteobacteria bacterium]
MPHFQPVSLTTHAAKRWRRYGSYAFAAQDAVAPLVAHELPRALLHLPIAFVAQGEQLMPVAVLGLQPGRNLFVAPDGRWLGGYTPAAYRGFPFQLAGTPDGQQVLVFDADSGLLSDTEGEPFFDEEGQPAKPVKAVLDFLSQVQANRVATQRICQLLVHHGVVQPWPITVKGAQGEQQVQGLHRIDEARLNQLDGAALQALQQAGALPVAYCQLLSMQHLATLGQLAQAHAQLQAHTPLPTTAKGELDLEFLNRDGTLSFGNL